jgi:tetratricopeptide (TPR) repeat protein
MRDSAVKIWEEKIIIPTYGIGKPEKNPMFFEKRVYQGSSGAVYPNPIVEKIYDEKVDKEYLGLFLENKYLKIMILPELGGRVQMAYDKIKERHFIYYNQVIKPALVGFTGPWISGGIEFNWPQHHRPSTFEPVDYKIVENTDGSKTVWISEVERMFHTKGMTGFTLYPDVAYLEIKAKLYNRTSLPQTFLWWANPAVKVNDYYQSVFPPDVNAVFDHGKRDVSTFPIATGTYYKVDYSPGTDISRYKNIPVPTSYMAIHSEYDFMGGYEHDTKAGVLHVANHHVSPGKKQWTWGHSDFGQAWDRNLTDEDGPYIELMTGVFTDNQPDFSWLMPNEEKSFTQYFLPYRELGLVKNATKDILVNIELEGSTAILKVFVTSVQKSLNILLKLKDAILLEECTNIEPEAVYEKSIALHSKVDIKDFVLVIYDAKHRELIRFEPSKDTENPIPESAKPATAPEDIEHIEQLFLTAQHLEQYRHATYSPVPYYKEALKRDPRDIRCNNGLGAWYLRRGAFAKAEPYFRKAVETLVARNPNPYDSEAYYNLGICLKYLGDAKNGYDALYKSTWSSAWQDSAFFSLAQMDVARGDLKNALEHIDYSIDRNSRNMKAHTLKALILRKLGRVEEAIHAADVSLSRDPFNLTALFEKVKGYKLLGEDGNSDQIKAELLALGRGNDHSFIDYSLDYAAASQYEDAIELLSYIINSNTSPLAYYYLAYWKNKLGLSVIDDLSKAKAADSYLCFPNRLEDIEVLKYALETNISDAKSPYYLGNLLYDKKQYEQAIYYWELSLERDFNFPTVHRNLGIAYFNKLNQIEKALAFFEKAFELDPSDTRILMELDQLYKRFNVEPTKRLTFIENNLHTALERDDVYLERASIYNFLGDYKKAYQLIMDRKFHPWEGGEGKVSLQYMISLVEQAKENIYKGNFSEAIAQLQDAQIYPPNLGEGKLYGAQENDIYYWLGCAYKGLKKKELAEEYWKRATLGLSQPGAAIFYNDQQPDKIFYQGLAWIQLGENSKADTIFNNLAKYGEDHYHDEISLDYFAVSLPNLLIFDDDLNVRNKVHCLYISGLGLLGLKKVDEAALAFNKALEFDAMHFGVKLHQMMLPLFSKDED